MEMEHPELDSLIQLGTIIDLEGDADFGGAPSSLTMPGGVYWQPSADDADLKVSAFNVPKTNIVSKRDMAVLDNLLCNVALASQVLCGPACLLVITHLHGAHYTAFSVCSFACFVIMHLPSRIRVLIPVLMMLHMVMRGPRILRMCLASFFHCGFTWLDSSINPCSW